MSELLVGLGAGFLLGMIGNTLVVYFQFRRSIAVQRVRWIREATQAMTSYTDYRGPLRDRYRFSLGVVIDILSQAWSDGYHEDGNWPPLIDCDDGQTLRPRLDRWSFFVHRVRPVMEDINSYAFLGLVRFLPMSRQLSLLSDLCIAVEEVVMRTDAAFEKQPVVELRKTDKARVRVYPISGIDDNDPRIVALRDGYRKLFHVWERWLKAA